MLLKEIFGIIPLHLHTDDYMITMCEVGDYSVYIKQRLPEKPRVIEGICIKSDEGDTFWAKEILGDSNGAVLFFNENIKDVFRERWQYQAIVFYSYDSLRSLYSRFNGDYYEDS